MTPTKNICKQGTSKEEKQSNYNNLQLRINANNYNLEFQLTKKESQPKGVKLKGNAQHEKY